MKDKKHGKNHQAEPAPAAEPTPPATPPVVPPPPAPEAVLKDQLLRLQADFDNFRKRVQRERVESQQQAAAQLITALLPAMDHFLLGLKNIQAHAQDKTLVMGFQMIYGQLMEALQQAGLAPLAVEGQPFDPNQHEAVTTIASEEHPEGTVITEVRRGYTLGGKLLRAAQVIVSSGPPATTAPVTPSAEAAGASTPKALPAEGAE
ncbi:MAG: nucleotide exchange factor GrpE [Verrucomicrobia bacterium]|nr:MAG: nucleotide exchange factor GrpE [Verrucomicrobiota bacterium]